MFKNLLDQFLDWLVTSSADPSEYALTIKAALLAGVGYAMPLITLLHLPVTAAMLTNEIGSACQVLGILLVIVGLVRKAVYLVIGMFHPATLPAATTTTTETPVA